MNKNISKVSFVLFSYNQSDYIEESIISALEQDYDNIEFIFSDDSSSDDTFHKIEMACERYPDRNITLNRNSNNLGVAEHVNKVVSLATGDIIVMAAGDDISLPTRVTQSVDFFNSNQDVIFISFNDIKINASNERIGTLANLTEDIYFTLDDYISGKRIPVSGASRVFRREVYDKFEPLNNNCPTEDTPYLLRGLYLGIGAILKSPGIYYRVHDNSLSAPQNIIKMKKDNIREQYYKDLDAAISLKLINLEQKNNVHSWIDYITLIKEKNTVRNINKINVILKLLRNKIFLRKLLKL